MLTPIKRCTAFSHPRQFGSFLIRLLLGLAPMRHAFHPVGKPWFHAGIGSKRRSGSLSSSHTNHLTITFALTPYILKRSAHYAALNHKKVKGRNSVSRMVTPR